MPPTTRTRPATRPATPNHPLSATSRHPQLRPVHQWGEADANYTLLDTGGYLPAANAYGIGAGFGFVVGALVSGVAVGSQAAINAGREGGLNNLENLVEPTSSSPSTMSPTSPSQTETELSDVADAPTQPTRSSTGAGTSIVTIATVLAAIEAAVIEGINVFTAAALPGQLATLISSAETTAPDVTSLESSSNGQATSTSSSWRPPCPRRRTRRVQFVPHPAGVTVTGGSIISEGSFTPCLNPTPIAPASATDPQFVVQEKGTTTSSTTSSISWQDAAAGTTTTARLSGNWFILNGSTQTLSITYTDWDGNEQVAWLVGSPTAGYQFVGYNLTAGNNKQPDPSTCLASGVCWTSASIDYVGSDGNDYSAYVQSPY